MRKRTPTPWEHTQTELGPDLKLFRARFDWVKNPRNNRLTKAVILEAPDWVNVVAVTREEKVVVVHQYRFGTGKVTTEIPAGIVKAGETSKEAAVRELREETGYTSEEWEYLGHVEPNPAFLNNACHHWLARDVERVHLPALDAGEDLSVEEMSLDELRGEITEDRLRHSLALVALSHVFSLWGKPR